MKNDKHNRNKKDKPQVATPLMRAVIYSGENSKITLTIMENAVFHEGAECSSFAPCGAARRSAAFIP